jgi:hypothetical protein
LLGWLFGALTPDIAQSVSQAFEKLNAFHIAEFSKPPLRH